MVVHFVRGDIFLTQTQTIAVGLSANGRLDVSPFYTTLQDRYPVFVSDYQRRSRPDARPPGSLWVWKQGRPWLVGMIVQESPQGATRLRYVEAAMLNLYKQWEHEGLRSLALMRFGDSGEWPAVRAVIEDYGSRIALPIVVYEDYTPGTAAEEAES